MESEQQYAYSDIELKAEVELSTGETVDFELSKFDMTYTLNAIPSGTMKVAIGTRPGGTKGDKEAAAHREAANIEQRTPVKIWAKIAGEEYRAQDGSSVRKWPEDKMLLLEGYMNRPAYSRGIGAASLKFFVDHWLADLAITSKLSHTLHPRSSADMLREALPGSFTGAISDLPEIDVDQQDFFDDVWKTGIKELFNQLLETDQINEEMFDADGQLKQQNQLAIDALAKMDVDGKIDLEALSLKDDLKDSIRDGGGEAEHVLLGGAIKQIISLRSGQTVWDTLITLANQFKYGIVANAESATLVPLVHVAKDPQYVTIGADEYESISDSSNNEVRALPIRGVGLFTNVGTFTIATDDDPVPSDLVGYFSATKEDNGDIPFVEGQLLMVKAPPWIDPAAFPNCSKETLVNIPAFGKYPPTAVNRKGEPEEGEVARESIQVPLTALGDELARSTYIAAVFTTRRCTISGRLRMDIAPGSLIKLELLGKNIPYYATSDGIGVLWGMVESVMCKYDAEAGRASTTFVITHIHTEAERKIKGLVEETHPLYNTAWKGTYIVKPEGA